MRFKKSLLATALLSVFALSGCNSGSSTATTTAPIQTKTITVIDGTLENAQICVDLNNNNQCDKSDKILPQLTNKEGEIQIPLKYATYPLIAQIIAGQTKDSDEVIPVAHSYSMITDANQSVITPFTTIAKIDPDNFSTIAEKSGLTDNELLSNFLGTPVARILARSITPVMTNDLTKIAEQKDTITKVANFIAQANDLKELENSRIIINKDGNAEAQPLIKNITDVLVGKTWSIASLNDTENAESGVMAATFNDTNHIVFKENGRTTAATYSIDKDNNFIATSNGDVDTQKILYVSADLIITVMNTTNETHDLVVWSTKDLNADQSLPVTNSQFIGKTWYMLMDDSDNSQAESDVIGLTFNTNGTLTASEPSESTENFDAGSWSIKDNILTTSIIDNGQTYTDVNTVLAQAPGYIVIKEIDDSQTSFSVLFNDKTRPMNILKQWDVISGTKKSPDDKSSIGDVTTNVNVAGHKDITELSIDTTEAGAKNPDADSPTITIQNGQVTYSDSLFKDGTYYVMGYNPEQTGNDLYAYGPLKVLVVNGRVQDLDFTHAPVVHATSYDND